MAKNLFTTQEALVAGGIAGVLAFTLTMIGIKVRKALEATSPPPVQTSTPPTSP